jgi:hypothetical protein
MNNEEVGVEGIWFKNGTDIEQLFYGPMDMKWFLDKIYGKSLSGHLAIYTKDIKNMYCFDTWCFLFAVMKAVELSKTMDIFFCIGLFSSDLLGGDYRDPKDITIVPGLWVNINILCSINTDKQLPTQREAFKFLKSQSMKPNFIVDAGSELQAYWIFDEPFIVENSADRDKIMKMSHDFQNKIIADGRRFGWQIDETSSISNLQRLPGTWNRKFNPPKPVKLMEYAHI